ncbi:MAG: phosphonate C-P lyase system protein PhnG [Pseudomonadota bacterium]
MANLSERQGWMGLMARAPAKAVAALWPDLGDEPAFGWLRAPETGAVMVRGRTSGSGAPFNVGEMTVTRCSLKLASGAVGHGYVQGRDKTHARRAAIVDALMQTDAAPDVRTRLLAPLAAQIEGAKATRAAKAAATRVDFFTLARGED